MIDQPRKTSYPDRAKIVAAALLAMGGGGAVTVHAMSSGPTQRLPAAESALADAQGVSKGTLDIVQDKDGLRLTLRATGIAPGPHGVHIHMVGKCDGPDFASAGAHWNPLSRQHGPQNAAGAHLGDLPNIEIGADGTGMVSYTLAASLDRGAHPLLDADGAAIVIHAGPDDMKTDPSGNSGGRIACGVITKAGLK